jgi:Fibronectin type III domain
VRLLKSATLLAACLFVLVGQPVQAASLNLAWDPPDSGSPAGYILGYGTQSGVYTNIVNVGPSTFFTVNGLSEGKTYFFVVVAYSAAGAISLPTPELRGALCSSAPSAPTGMSVNVSGTLVNVSWAPSSGGAVGYVLYAGATPGSTSLANVWVDGTSFSAHAPPGTYYLSTVAVNDCGGSGLSGEIVATVGGSAEVLPGAPRSLTRTVSGSTVRLTWVQPASGGAARRYIIEAMNGTQVIAAFDTGSADTSISHPAVPPGRYVVRVRAANSAGVGPPSSTVTVVVP